MGLFQGGPSIQVKPRLMGRALTEAIASVIKNKNVEAFFPGPHQMWVMGRNILGVAMKKDHQPLWFFALPGVGKVPTVKRITIFCFKAHLFQLKPIFFGVTVKNGVGVIKKLRTRLSREKEAENEERF